MEELMTVANVAIVFGVIYKLFELFVGRKERMMLIEKLPPEMLKEKTNGKFNIIGSSTFFTSLRFGCLLLGIGVGLITAYFIIGFTLPQYFTGEGYYIRQTASVIYGASVLIGGGLGLIASFLVELKQNKKQN